MGWWALVLSSKIY